MTTEEAITEERSRYIRAIIAHSLNVEDNVKAAQRHLRAAHRHLLALHRLAVNGYTRFSHELDQTLRKEVV